MKRVLITGHEGFIGRNFLNYFKYTNEDTFVLGLDIKSGNDCRDYFRNFNDKFDLVIHCAAIVGGREKIEGQPLEVASDLAIDSDFFNWAVRTEQPRLVYFSSSAAYPTSLQGKENAWILKENEIDVYNNLVGMPDATYGWVKLTGELLADYVNKTTNTKVHVFRPFSGYGEDQDLTYPFPSFVKRIRDKVDTFEIWGNGEHGS